MINDKIKGLLTQSLVDLVVYGENEACNKCKLIEEIRSDFTNKKYTLREPIKNIDNNDVSINRCALESYGFLPEKFKLGNPTPGKENDCSGPQFILEDKILEATPQVHSNTVSEFDYDDFGGASSSKSCTSTIETVDYSC